MSSIYAGRYTYRDLFKELGYDFTGKSAASYNNGAPDFRRVKVGGVGFDSLDDVIVIPYTTDIFTITLDGVEDEIVTVQLTAEDQLLRQRSFTDAIDASDLKA